MAVMDIVVNPSAVAGFFGVFGVLALLKYVSLRNGNREPALKKKAAKLSKLPHFSSSDPEIVVVGGGILGATFAAKFGMEGKRVVMIERDMGTCDTFRGELLLPGGINLLDKLGMKDVLDDVDGHVIRGLAFYDKRLGGGPACLYYPNPKGLAMHHGSLVDALRKAVKNQKSVTIVEAVGKELIKENGRVVGVKYRKKGDHEVKEVRAPLVVVGDGYYSTLSTEFRTTHQPISDYTCIGFLVDNYPWPNGNQFMEVGIGHPDAQAAVYKLNEHDTRAAIFISGPTPSNIKDFCEKTVIPALPEHMKKSLLNSIKNGSRLRAIPCKRMAANFDSLPGVLVLGDALNTRNPVTASGMTVALHDICFWWDVLINKVNGFTDDEGILKQKLVFRKERQKWAFTTNVFAEFLIRLINGHDASVIKLEQFVFNTLLNLAKDGPPESHPVYNIFGGVETDKTVLNNVLDGLLAGTIQEIYNTKPYLIAIWESMKFRRKWNAILNDIMKPEAMT